MTATTTTAPTVATVMTRCPVTVSPHTPFHGIAALLSGSRIGAVPVTDDSGALVGVVSEMDLIRAGVRASSSLADLTARDVMNARPATTRAAEPLPAAARQLSSAGVRRLFVVEGGRLVGVLSRRDLLRSYLRADDDIREQVERDVLASLPREHTVVHAGVENGVVLLVGRVQWRSALAGIDTVVRAVPGVVEVRNRLGFQWDDGVGPRRSAR
jgi:CBS domain-containing protein